LESRGVVVWSVTTVSLEEQAQCGNLARQCWDTQTYSSTLEGARSVPGVYLTGDATSWFEMENNGSRAYGGSNVMLVRNESSTDMSLVAMLASCSPVALQG
jgi:hypothetical protein